MPSGLSDFTKAFVGPAVRETFAVTQQYAAARFGPPMIPPPTPPEEPYQYLPTRGPYTTGATWRDGLGTIGSLLEITALFVGIGAVLGITAGLCIGRDREKAEVTSSDQSVHETTEESESSETISDFAGWAEKHFDERSSHSGESNKSN